MNRCLSLLGLSALVAGCASAPQPDAERAAPPTTETMIHVAPAPSALAGLGITERVVTQQPGLQRSAERAISDVSRPLASCFRSSVDRDPTLAGSITYDLQFDAGSIAASLIRKEGTLASLPSAECARKVLALVSIPAAVSSVGIRYEVAFTGSYRPEPLPERQVAYRVAAWSVDWSDQNALAPDGFGHSVIAEKEAFYRCLVGAEPKRTVPSWVVLNVGADGSVTQDDARLVDDEAEHCIRRKLSAIRFPKHSRPVAVGTLFHAPPPPPPAREPAIPEEASADGRGNMQGDEIGEAFGAGGLGLRGIGEGGGGTGIGLGSIGTLGRGVGTGTGQGFGSGSGRLGGSHRTKPPSVKAGSATVGPKYEPEVVQRIVRQNFGRFRLCYENGLRRNPNLEGKVEVSFVISRDGSATSVTAAGTMPDKTVISCITRSFSNLRFPKPESGIIKVNYPIVFSPDGSGSSASSSAPATPTPPPVAKIDGTPLDEVDAARIAARLRKMGYEVRPVPAAPGAAAPRVVFYRSNDDVVGYVRITKAGSSSAEDCVRSHGGVSLTVSDDKGRCASVMSVLVD